MPGLRLHGAMRVSRRKGISVGLRFAILRRDKFGCFYCGRAAPNVELEVDHIVPVAGGGTDGWENLITACRDCNAGKSDKEFVSAAQDYTRWNRLRENLAMVKRWRTFLGISEEDLPESTCKMLSAILPDPREAGPRLWTEKVDFWTSNDGVAEGIRLFHEFMREEAERQEARGEAQ